MVPGMSHCRGGIGVDHLDAMTSLVNWVEGGVAPDSIIATREEEGVTTLSRPLCPYPQVAKYDGTGSADEASSFACINP
jgi:feruloyl esterase